MNAFKKALKEAVEKAREIEEKAREYAEAGKAEAQREYRSRMAGETLDSNSRFSLTYRRILSAFPNAQGKGAELRKQLGSMQKWAEERKDAVIEYRNRMKTLKKEYREKVKAINRKKGKEND